MLADVKEFMKLKRTEMGRDLTTEEINVYALSHESPLKFLHGKWTQAKHSAHFDLLWAAVHPAFSFNNCTCVSQYLLQIILRFPNLNIMDDLSKLYLCFAAAYEMLSQPVPAVLFLYSDINVVTYQKAGKRFRVDGTKVVAVGDNNDKSWDQTHGLKDKFKRVC